jgi:hypothetical protein
VLLHENPSSYQSNANQHADSEPLTEQDQIHACHCMSLPTVSQNTQYYLQAGCGVACAMASAEVALFVGALSFAVRSVGGVVFAVRSFWRRVLCGSILSEASSLRFDHSEESSLRFNHSEASSLPFDHWEALSLGRCLLLRICHMLRRCPHCGGAFFLCHLLRFDHAKVLSVLLHFVGSCQTIISLARI